MIFKKFRTIVASLEPNIALCLYTDDLQLFFFTIQPIAANDFVLKAAGDFEFQTAFAEENPGG